MRNLRRTRPAATNQLRHPARAGKGSDMFLPFLFIPYLMAARTLLLLHPYSLLSHCHCICTTKVQTTGGSLVVRASDSRPEDLGSMPNATKYPPRTHGVRARQISGFESLMG
ncbi:hypothetical protein TNCV_1039751 [Trichonephila clavipes]|nr:hypothetical protein TNCV_1039751 [Trichonephila clavipes]